MDEDKKDIGLVTGNVTSLTKKDTKAVTTDVKKLEKEYFTTKNIIIGVVGLTAVFFTLKHFKIIK